MQNTNSVQNVWSLIQLTSNDIVHCIMHGIQYSFCCRALLPEIITRKKTSVMKL